MMHRSATVVELVSVADEDNRRATLCELAPNRLRLAILSRGIRDRNMVASVFEIDRSWILCFSGFSLDAFGIDPSTPPFRCILHFRHQTSLEMNKIFLAKGRFSMRLWLLKQKCISNIMRSRLTFSLTHSNSMRSRLTFKISQRALDSDSGVHAPDWPCPHVLYF